MQIDWLTLVIQMFNFTILIVILKKFLYNPIFRVMEERRQSIQKKVEDSDKKVLDAGKKEEEYLKKVEEFEASQKKLKASLLSDIEKKRQNMLDKLEEEISLKKENVKNQILREKDKILSEFVKVSTNQFVDFANKVFSTLANTNIEKQSIEAFVKKLSSIDKKDIDIINHNLKNENNSIVKVTTVFEMENEYKEKITKALKELNIQYKGIECSINKDLILGVELQAGSYCLAWTVQEAVNNFKNEITKLIG